MSDESKTRWRACDPYPACEGPDMGWHVRTDDDDEEIICECRDEATARLITADHNRTARMLS